MLKIIIRYCMIGWLAVVCYLPSALALETAEEVALAKKARVMYAAAQKQWQTRFEELVITKQPDLKEIAALAMDLQLALTDLRSQRFYYLLESAPEKLKLTDNLEEFANFPWTPQDERALLRKSSQYKMLGRRIYGLQYAHNRHPDWKKFRQFFRESLVEDKAYIELVAYFKRRLEKVAKILKRFK